MVQLPSGNQTWFAGKSPDFVGSFYILLPAKKTSILIGDFLYDLPAGHA